MRPKKERFVECEPGERCFRPRCKKLSELERVSLSIDEFEAVRLYDLEGLEQSEVAGRMNVHRSTVSRMLDSAHRKIADALVNIKAIRIEGGCYRLTGEKDEPR